MLGFGGRFGVFPVDIKSVEAEVFDEIDGRGGELLAAGGS